MGHRAKHRRINWGTERSLRATERAKAETKRQAEAIVRKLNEQVGVDAEPSRWTGQQP